jgi:catechol 2,3-dioxygenase-like lactoylglutathione lyase family enzyme
MDVDWKIELVVVSVADVDRAKAFYVDRAGFTLDVDHSAGEDFRVVQLTPRGSACSIALMKNVDAAGSAQGLQLIVADIDSARTELAERGLDAGEPTHIVPTTTRS